MMSSVSRPAEVFGMPLNAELSEKYGKGIYDDADGSKYVLELGEWRSLAELNAELL